MSSRFDLVPQGQRFVEQYVPLPLDLILKSGAMKQAEQDKAQSEKLDFLGRQVNALEPDKPLVRKYKQDLDQELSTKWADKDFTDPSVRSAWAKRKRELANEYGPQGKIGAIEANYNAYKEYEKHIIDKAKDLGWSENYLRQHLNDVKNKFQGTIDPDNSNYYRSIQTPGLAKYVNTTEWFDKAIKNVAADTNAFGLSKELSPNQVVDIWRSGKVEHKDYNKIVNALATLAKGDVDFINSLRQEGEFTGVQGNENFISGYDKSGNIILNPNSSFSKTLSGGAYGAKYRKEDIDRMQIEDKLKLHEKKGQFDEQNAIPLQQTMPSSTVPLMNKALGVSRAIDNNGQIKIDKLDSVNWKDLSKNMGYAFLQSFNPFFTGGEDLAKDIVSSNQLDTKAKDAVHKKFQEMAKIVNIPYKKDDKTYTEIYNAYNKFTEGRHTDIAYDNRISPGYSKQLNEQPNNYYYYNDQGVLQNSDSNESLFNDLIDKDKKKVVLGRRLVYVNGNPQYMQEVQMPDNSIVYAKYKGEQETNHYDYLAGLLDSQVKFLKNYKAYSGSDPIPRSNTIGSQKDVILMANEIQREINSDPEAKKAYSGQKIASIDVNPSDPRILAVTFYDEKNPTIMSISQIYKDGKNMEVISNGVNVKDFVSEVDSEFNRSPYSPVKAVFNKTGSSLNYDTEIQ